MACIHYLNSLFDIQLGKYETGKLVRHAAEMSTLFIPVAKQDDKVLLDVSVPHEYMGYLKQYGIKCKGLLHDGEKYSDTEGFAWGWDRNAVDRLTGAGAVCKYPNLDIVKCVNSRSFSYKCNQVTKNGVPGSVLCESLSELVKRLQVWKYFPFVIKPVFGNAGYGFIRKKEARLQTNEIKCLENYFLKCGKVVLEPWYDRFLDISSRCFIMDDGTITGIRHHRTLSNRAGTFFADILATEDKKINTWRDVLDNAVYGSAVELVKAGYFGNVGFDSFVWHDDNGRKQLAAIIEINARHTINTVAYALHNKFAKDNFSLFRFISRRRHKLPDSYCELERILSKDTYNRKSHTGVILITPLRIGQENGKWVQPLRSAFFLVEKNEKCLIAMDERIRRKFLY